MTKLGLIDQINDVFSHATLKNLLNVILHYFVHHFFFYG